MAIPTAFVGIDPGASGALCLLVPRTQQMAFVKTTATTKDLLDWFKQINDDLYLAVIMLEKVHAIRGTSAKSNFSFGYNVGVVNTIALAAGNSVSSVTPKKWQKFVGVTKKGPLIKKDVAEICIKIYPKSQPYIYGPRGGLLDGRSDALMIAHYASQTYKTY